jgi:hypothetical protein
MTAGFWFRLRSHSAAPWKDTERCCREPGEAGVVAVGSGSPDAG